MDIFQGWISLPGIDIGFSFFRYCSRYLKRFFKIIKSQKLLQSAKWNRIYQVEFKGRYREPKRIIVWESQSDTREANIRHLTLMSLLKDNYIRTLAFAKDTIDDSDHFIFL